MALDPPYGPRKRRSMVLTENVYEGMFILDSSRYGHDPEAVSGQIDETIQKFGGTILVSRLWEERRLAYPIKSHRKGTYWLTYFRLPGAQLVTLKRECQINEVILRYLFLEGRSADCSTPWWRMPRVPPWPLRRRKPCLLPSSRRSSSIST